MPGKPSYLPPRKPPSGSGRKFKRGDLVSCEDCGYVFVAHARTGVVCRRCNSQDLEAWKRQPSGRQGRRML